MEASQHSLLAACFTLHSINATLAIVPQHGAGLWIIGVYGLLLFCLFMYVDKIFEQIYSLSISLNFETKHFAWDIKYL
jgi:hypothetical protein